MVNSGKTKGLEMDKIPNLKHYRKVGKIKEELDLALNLLDLQPLRAKLAEKYPGDPRLLELIEIRYRRFLYLVATTGEELVPSEDIDELWHIHILDTIKYRNDCQNIFGFFLDHFPYFGLQGDREDWKKAHRRTIELYVGVFGEEYSFHNALRDHLSKSRQSDPRNPEFVLYQEARSCG